MMKFNRDPLYLDVLIKKEYNSQQFLGRHYLTVLSGDGWVRALRKKHPSPRKALQWGLRCRARLVERHVAQTRVPA